MGRFLLEPQDHYLKSKFVCSSTKRSTMREKFSSLNKNFLQPRNYFKNLKFESLQTPAFSITESNSEDFSSRNVIRVVRVYFVLIIRARPFPISHSVHWGKLGKIRRVDGLRSYQKNDFCAIWKFVLPISIDNWKSCYFTWRY